MGVYNREDQQYDLNRQFRLNNGTVWSYSSSLIFWLRASEGATTFFDKSGNFASITSSGSGHLNVSDSPPVKFPFDSLRLDNKFVTVGAGQAADSTDKKSLIFSGWVYLNVSPALNNKGFCLLHSTASTGFTIFIDDQGRLAIRLTNKNSGGTLASAKVQTTKKPFTANKWHHFIIEVRKEANSTANFKAAGNVNIFVNGQKKAVNVPSDVGSPNLDPKLTGTSYKVGNGPAEDETEADVQLNGKLADIFLLQPEGNLDESVIRALYTATVKGAKHLGSGFLSPTPFNLANDAFLRQTHPTVARSSNDGRTGNHSTVFDDTRAIHLTNNSATNFPSMLPAENQLFQTIYNGHVNGQLTSTAASASFGIFDEYYEENGGVAIKPFIESKVYIDSGSTFYQTGTLDSVIPGFDQPLKNKFQITIEGEMPATTLGNTTAEIDHGDAGGQNKTNITNWRSNFSGSFMAYIAGNGRQNLPGFFWNQDDVTEPYRHGCVGFSYPYILGRSVGRHGDNGTFNDGKGITLSPFKANNYYQGFGHPTDAYGFPDGSKYKAEDNMLIKMSDYITEPFLLEKIVFDIPGGTAFTDIGSGFYRNPIQHLAIGKGGSYRSDPLMFSSGDIMLTAFLMHQTQVANSGSISLNFLKSTTSTKLEFPVTGSTSRHLITYANSLYYHKFSADGKSVMVSSDGYWDNGTSNTGGLHNSGMNSSGVIPDFTTTFSTTYVDTTTGAIIKSLLSGSVEKITELSGNSSTQQKSESIPRIVLHTTPKVATDQGFLGVTTQQQTNSVQEDDAGGDAGYQGIANPFFATTGTQITTFAWRGGPSSINETSNPRLYTKQIPGKSNTVIENLNFSNGGGASESSDLSISDSDVNNTMYLLFPDDKLIFGLQAIAGRSSRDGPKTGFNLNAGPYKITLFGSFLREEIPKRNNLSQNFQTQTVHESIGADTVCDSYGISYTGEYTGSFSDDVISGSADPKTLYVGYDHVTGETINLARRVSGRATQGTQGETGALKRYFRISDSKERLYDSVLPDFGKVMMIDNSSSAIVSNGGVTSITIGKASGNAVWPFAFPFEPRYSGIGRSDSITIPGSQTRNPGVKIYIDDDSAGIKSAELDAHTGAPLTGSFIVPRNSENAKADNSSGIKQIMTEGDALRLLYGIGAEPRGIYYARGQDTAGGRIGTGAKAASVANIAGYKYGIENSRPCYTSAVFRRDSFGQFRDLIEPRYNVASLINNTLTFPVEQKFFTRNGQPLAQNQRSSTNSSNLSTNATSSLPFFDRPNDAGPLNRDASGPVQPVNISPNFAPGNGPFLVDQ